MMTLEEKVSEGNMNIFDYTKFRTNSSSSFSLVLLKDNQSQ